jgi:ubiquinone/menaquinone biosynthesis C-methylase UbiE
MRINTTAWNRVRYGAAAPFYDLVTAPLQALGWASARRRALELLAPKPGSRLLIAGAGTGLDLEHIPPGVEVVATDLSPRMVQEVSKRAGCLDIELEARVMDAESMSFSDEEFDHAILHLVLAVVSDPYSCVREVARVLKPGGTVSIFDKFVPDGEAASPFRHLQLVQNEKAFFDFFTIAIAEKRGD